MGRLWKELFDRLKSNPVLGAIVMIQAFVVIVLCIRCLRAERNLSFTQENLSAVSETVESVISENGESGYHVTGDVYESAAETEDAQETEDETDTGTAEETQDNGEVILTTGYFTLYPGAYRVTVRYTCKTDSEDDDNMDISLGAVQTEGYSVYYHFTDLELLNGTDTVNQTLQINSPGKISAMKMNVNFYGEGELTVYSIEIKEIPAYRVFTLLLWLMVFGVHDVIFYRLFVDKDSTGRKELAVLTCICAAGLLPFAADYVFVGHDTGFHAYRIALLAEELARGNYFPAVYSAALNGYGYAAPLFYNQLFLYIPAVLYLYGFSLTFVYNLYLGIMTVTTCLIMYYCALKIFQKTNTALLAAALYTLSAVRLTNVFTRAAFGEMTAQTFLPLVFLGFYYIYSAQKGEKISLRHYWPIVVGMTGIASSHTLTLLMSVMVIFVVCLFLIRKTLQPARLAGLMKATAVTLAVNLASVVPMLSSMSMDLNLDHAYNYMQASGTYLIQLFNSVVNNYQGDNISGTASAEMSLSIGFSITLGLILGVICFYHFTKQSIVDESEKKERGFLSLCWGMTALTLFFSTVYMFYDFLDFLPAKIYLLLGVYQFPWRWLSFATLFGVFLTVAVADRKEVLAVFYHVPSAFILCAVLVLNTGQIYSDQLRTSELYRFSNNLHDDAYQLGSAEYLPYGTDKALLSHIGLMYEENQLAVVSYVYEESRWLLTVENLTAQTAGIHIPLLSYDHYVAYDLETGEKIDWVYGYNYRIYLYIPASYCGTLAIEYQIPLLWKLASAASLITDIILIGAVIGMYGKKKLKAAAV